MYVLHTPFYCCCFSFMYKLRFSCIQYVQPFTNNGTDSAELKRLEYFYGPVCGLKRSNKIFQLRHYTVGMMND